ncbi:MAG: TlpA family protein disulfide reductase [Mucilaginibacter sp.]|nr:TlpA family protein disulfide reductase [Mucilaginibacter sp.]
MKYLSAVFFVLLFAACKHSQSGQIEITGTADGVTFGNVLIRDQVNTPVYRADVTAGKFHLKEVLQYAGYYKMTYSSSAARSGTREVEVYLEPGTYAIDIDQEKINDYPYITASSPLQTQLSAFNAIRDTARHEAHNKAIDITKQMQQISDTEIKSTTQIGRINQLQAQQLQANQIDEVAVFKEFMSKYPDNAIAGHLMKALPYQDNPVAYYAIFNKFSMLAKNSDDGKDLEIKLKELNKLAPGSPAPAISGTTPDGKPVDIKALHKKIILLDFWRSTNGSSRDNHEELIRTLLPQLSSKGFGVVSVSLDTDNNKWRQAIAADGMDWPQISDLKGDDSPNAGTWGIKSIPTYYLLDGNGKIIVRVAEFVEIDAAISDYLSKH